MNQALNNLLNNDKTAQALTALINAMQGKEYAILRPTLANLDNQNKGAFMFDAWDLLTALNLPKSFDVVTVYSPNGYGTTTQEGVTYQADYAVQLIDHDSDKTANIGFLYSMPNCLTFYPDFD